MQSGKVDLSDVRFFVLDEADRLLDSGDSEIIFKMYEGIPKTTQRLQARSKILHMKKKKKHKTQNYIHDDAITTAHVCWRPDQLGSDKWAPN